MFDLHGVERLNEWKRFRDHLENSDNVFQDLAEYWAAAPFVNSYLNPYNSKEWPDPWQLILDGKYDSLAIGLGMLYTIKLTEKFKDLCCEIYKTNEKNEAKYFLMVDNSSILNYEYRSVRHRNDLNSHDFILLWSKPDRL